MPRSLEITVPTSRTASLLERLRKQDGVLNLGLRPNGSLQPPGDIITLQCANDALVPLTCLFDEEDIGRAPGTSLTSSLPASIVSREAAPVVTRESSDSSWEEVEQMLARESHMNANSVAIMFVSGFFAAAGIASGTLHVVIAAMVIAPGFEPFVRIALGAVTGSQAWRRGLASALGGYAVLIVGAAVASLILSRTGTTLLTGTESYERSEALVQLWSTFSVTSVSVAVLAGIAGTLLVISHRSVLTSGVMIALALIPAASLSGMGIVAGDWALFRAGLLRFAVEAAIVTVTALVVFYGKRVRGRRRRMML